MQQNCHAVLGKINFSIFYFLKKNKKWKNIFCIFYFFKKNKKMEKLFVSCFCALKTEIVKTCLFAFVFSKNYILQLFSCVAAF